MSRFHYMLANADAPVSTKETLAFMAVSAGLTALAFTMHVEYPLFLLVCALLGAFIVMQNAMVWIILSILLFIPVFWNIEAGLTPPEVLHTFVYYGGLLWWFFHRAVISKERFHWKPGGIFAALLLLQMLLIGPMSIAQGADPYVWLRELVIVSTVLMLVPISHECVTRKRQYAVGAALIAVLFALSLKNLYLYKQKVVEAVWLWQVGASRSSETFFLIFVLAVAGAAILISARRPWTILLTAVVFATGVAATILSFYRTIWVAALAGYVFMGMTLGSMFWRRALGYVGVVAVVIGVTYPIFLAKVVPVEVMWSSISSRFESIGGYSRDISVSNREAEARAIMNDIDGHWFLGKGLSVPTHFTKLTSMTTIEPTWTHTGYAWILRHYGILGSIFLFSAWLYYAGLGVRTIRLLRRESAAGLEENFRIRLFTAAGVAIICSSFLISVTINQFFSHEAGLVFAVIFGLTEVWHRDALSRSQSGAV